MPAFTAANVIHPPVARLGTSACPPPQIGYRYPPDTLVPWNARTMTNPNDTAANVRLAINIMAAFAVGDDPKLSWSKVENVLAQEHGTFRLLQGFIALTGMLLQEFEFNVSPPVAPQTMLQKLADRA
jgi:hypothetical protein